MLPELEKVPGKVGPKFLSNFFQLVSAYMIENGNNSFLTRCFLKNSLESSQVIRSGVRKGFKNTF